MLSLNLFKTVVESTPLVSIDLIVRNVKGEILLGKRRNRPAQGYWFVPGGRIYKNENIAQAFKRLTSTELSTEILESETKFLGVFEHFYTDSMFDTGLSTHYVVLAYELIISNFSKQLPVDQHFDYCWLSIDNLMKHSYVHQYSKLYFENNNNDEEV